MMNMTGKTDTQEESTRERVDIGLAVVTMTVVAGLLVTPAPWRPAMLTVLASLGTTTVGWLLLRAHQRHPRARLCVRDLAAHRQGRAFAAQVERWLHSDR
jgi:hypothetical protein